MSSYHANIPCTVKPPTVLHHLQAVFLPWQECLPGAGIAVVGSAVAGLADIEGLSVSGAIVHEGLTVGIALSLGVTVEGALVITVVVGVGPAEVIGDDSVGTAIG